MANYNFNLDILIGNEGEKILINDLTSLGASLISTNNTNSHDILVLFNNEHISYECKTDVFNDTGNMFIETHCRNKPSGISVTKAKWFVTYYKHLNELWYIKTEKLLELLNNNEHKIVNKSGDANSNTQGYLLNKNMYRDEFIVRDSIKHIEIIKKWQKKYKKNYS